MTWIERRDLIDAAGLATLEREAAAHPRMAARELAATIALREYVFRVFSDARGGLPPASSASGNARTIADAAGCSSTITLQPSSPFYPHAELRPPRRRPAACRGDML